MEIYKLIAVAVITACICVYLKSVNSELYTLALIAGSVIILVFAVNYLSETFELFRAITERTGVDGQLFVLVVKITAVAYLIEFAGGLIEDFGLKGLADKLVFVGKIILLCMSVPVFNAVLGLLCSFLGE